MRKPKVANLTLHPTGRCFDDALEFLENEARRGLTLEQAKRLCLVHGVCLSADGHLFAHAWVESGDDMVISAGLLRGKRIFYKMDRATYYAKWCVEEAHRYTLEQASSENYRSGHFGPWRPDYLALCKDAGDRA